MDEGIIYTLFLALSLLGCSSAELCSKTYRYYNSKRDRTRTFSCSFGCCGEDHNQYCCVSHAGVIVGIVFACIFGLAFVAACVCCFIKHQSSRGRLVRPSASMVDHLGASGATTQTNVFIVPSGTGPPAYTAAFYSPFQSDSSQAYPMVPPSYEIASAPLPGYSRTPPPSYSNGGYDESADDKTGAQSSHVISSNL